MRYNRFRIGINFVWNPCYACGLWPQAGMGVRAATNSRLARPVNGAAPAPLFLCPCLRQRNPRQIKIRISCFCSDGVCEQRSYCIHNILLFIIVRRPVFNQLVGTGYLIIKRLAFIDLSYRSLSDEFFLRLFHLANIWKISLPTTNWQPLAMPLFSNADTKISLR